MKHTLLLSIAFSGFAVIGPMQSASAQEIPQIPASELVEPGKLIACADAPVPPYTLVSADGAIVGMDPELLEKIAGVLGLKAETKKTVFNTIIAALTGRKCDVIMGAMNITGERQKVITQIPYAQDGQNFAVKKGNPKNFPNDHGFVRRPCRHPDWNYWNRRHRRWRRSRRQGFQSGLRCCGKA